MQFLLKHIGEPGIFFGVLCLVAIVGLVSGTLVFAAWRTRRQLESAADAIRALNTADPNLLARIEAELPQRQSLMEQWLEFKEGIVEIDSVCRNTFQADQVFVEDAVFADIRIAGIPYGFLQLAPTMATGFGILGTFVGISLGLGRIDFVGDITASVQLVLPALSSAFATSIVGVAFALIIEFFANGSAAKMDSALHSLREAIDRKIERITTEELLNGVRSDLTQHSESLDSSVNTLKDTILSGLANSNLNRLEQRLSQTHVQHVATNLKLDTFHQAFDTAATASIERENHTNALLVRLEESTSETRDTIQVVAERVMDHLDQAFTNSLAKVLGPHLQRLIDIVDHQVSTASDQATDQSRRFVDEMVSDLKSSLAGSFDSLGGRLESASSQLATAGADLQAVVVAARDTVGGQEQVLERGRAMMQSALSQGQAASERLINTESAVSAIGDLSTALQAQQAHLLENQRAQAVIQQRTERQLADVVDLLKAHREQESQSRAALQQLAVSMNGTLGQSQTTLNEVLSSLTAELAKLETSVGATRESASAGADSLLQVVGQLNARVEAEAALLEGYQSAASNFGDAFERGKPTVEALSATASDLRRQQVAVQTLSERLEGASHSLQRITDTVGGTLTAATQQMQAAGQGFEQTVKSADEWAENTTQSIERFSNGMSDAVQRSLTAYDSSLSSAVGSLSTAIKELEDVAEELTAMAAKTGGRR